MPAGAVAAQEAAWWPNPPSLPSGCGGGGDAGASAAVVVSQGHSPILFFNCSLSDMKALRFVNAITFSSKIRSNDKSDVRLRFPIAGSLEGCTGRRNSVEG